MSDVPPRPPYGPPPGQPPGPPYGPPYPPGYGPPPPPPPKPGVVPLAPLSFGAVLLGAATTWLRNWRVVVPICAVASVVLALLLLPLLRSSLALSSVGPSVPPEQMWETLRPGLQNLAIAWPLYILATAVVSGLVGGMLAVVGRQAVLGQPAPWALVWSRVRPHALRLVGLSLVIWLLATVGLLFCIVPGIMLFTLWCLAVPALVTEGLTIGQALSRSWRLVKHDGLRVFAVLVVVVLLTSVVDAVLSGPLSALGQFPLTFGGGPEPGWGVTTLLALSGAISSTLTLAALPLTTLLLYVDQRIRLERYDLQLGREVPGLQ